MATTTYSAIMNKIRELSFDRYITPTFFITATKDGDKWTFQITATSIVITDNRDSTPVIHEYLFADYVTLDLLLQQIVATVNEYIDIVYSGSYIPSEPSNSLNLVSETTLTELRPAYRKYYFSDAIIEEYFDQYAYMHLGASIEDVENTVWETDIASPDFQAGRQEHFSIWVAYNLVSKRRLYELAGQVLKDQSMTGGTYGSNGRSSYSLNIPGQSIQVQIGSVFTLQEDSGAELGISDGGAIPQGMLPPWQVGTDNELMDYYSFWYRLQLWLRKRFETLFGDYSLRDETVIEGKLYLDRYSANKYWSWFESYPWAWARPLRDQRHL